MIKAAVGEELDAWVLRLLPWVARIRLAPNTLTVLGAGISTGAALLLASGRLKLGAGVLLLGAGFDLVDGVVARQRGIATPFGAFLDSTLDRWVDAVVLVGLSVHFARLGEPGHVALAGVALATSSLVSYSKARAEKVLPRFEVGIMERGERIGLLILGCALGIPVLALWIVTLGSSFTAAQRIARARREMSRLDDPSQEPTP